MKIMIILNSVKIMSIMNLMNLMSIAGAVGHCFYTREAFQKNTIESVSMVTCPSDPPSPHPRHTVSALGYFLRNVFFGLLGLFDTL